MSKMRKDAKDTLKLWAKFPDDKREFAMGILLLDRVCLEKIIQTMIKTEDENKMIKELYQLVIAYYNSKKSFICEFDNKIDF